MGAETDYQSFLIDGSTGEPVKASIRSQLSIDEVLAVEEVWGPHRIAAIRRMLKQGQERIPQHYHWNWSSKLMEFDMLQHRILGVEVEQQIQGLMWVTLRGPVSRMQPDQGKPLIYVDFLESAPWNTRSISESPRYKIGGLRLIESAVRLSVELGYEGRVGLHALSQAEQFYQQTCGMIAGAPDRDHEGLRYFELSTHHAGIMLLRG